MREHTYEVELAMLTTELHELGKRASLAAVAANRHTELITAIHEHLQTLKARGAEPDLKVQKVAPTSWLRSLFIPDEQIVRGSGGGHFRTVDVVNAWKVPGAHETAKGYHTAALITEDGFISSTDHQLPSRDLAKGIEAIISDDLVPIETADSLTLPHEPRPLSLTTDWPHIASHLGGLAAS